MLQAAHLTVFLPALATEEPLVCREVCGALDQPALCVHWLLSLQAMLLSGR